MSCKNRSFGNYGEKLAAEYLTGKGFSVIACNYRFGRYGEIDIIAVRDNMIVFAEVKSRKNQHFGGAIYSVSRKKIMNLRKCANYFIMKNPEIYRTSVFRFDLICVSSDGIDWIENIIPF